MLHSDGNLNSILDDVVELGIDGYNPVQRSAHMDIFALKQKYRNRLCLVGNVDSNNTLSLGSPDDVQAETLELLERVAPSGAFILCSDSDLRDEMPVENILAMVKTGKLYGKYPIT